MDSEKERKEVVNSINALIKKNAKQGEFAQTIILTLTSKIDP